MAREKTQGSNRNPGSEAAPPQRQQQLQNDPARQQQQWEQRDERNKTRFVTQYPEVEASDLPDKGRGGVETNAQWEAARNLPQQHGGSDESNHEGGLRGSRDLNDADQHGGRKHN